MALHHHLIPVASVEAPNSRGVSLTLDAIALLDAASNSGIQIGVHGHQHLPRVVRYEHVARRGEPTGNSLTIVAGGSAGVVQTRRGAERNTYSLFRFRTDGVHLTLRELRTDGVAGAPLFDLTLPIKPLLPGSGTEV